MDRDAVPLVPLIQGPTLLAWRTVQVVVWAVGAAIFLALIVAPDVGLDAFWNVLIPVAPALLAFAPGLWRNICPLASTALLPRHLNLSKQRRIPAARQALLTLVGVLALLLIVPLRHVVLDLNGPATAGAIAALAVVAVLMGRTYEWKSGWCSSLCPVHPVEKLYGSESLVSPPNAHCDYCHKCVTPCPDSTPGYHPLAADHHRTMRVGGILMVGGFAGFIWGWFHVRDYAGSEGWRHLDVAFGLPFLGLLVTVALYLVLKRVVPERHGRLLVLAFAAAAIACYYWYRLPALFGYGPFPGDGMLVDLRGTLPSWFPTLSRIATTVLFAWWLVWRAGGKRSWTTRPDYA